MVQRPGGLERTQAAPGYWGTTLIDGAGHWVQQEQPKQVVESLLRFLQSVPGKQRPAL